MDTSSCSSWSLSEDRPVVALWGCELGTGARSYVVQEEDDVLEHLVLLKTISLGADTGDELHVVTADSKKTSAERRPVPIAVLRSSRLLTVSLVELEFIPPVTFELQCGAGPVYLSGQYITCECHPTEGSGWEDDVEEELSEEDVADEDDEGAF
ncbi:nucleoplasmin-like [Prinia subflava]|uniref:nucleoplasmin-like n=1 Tax=Prinia subflava TaxID=208062 RepID=UPI002FDFA829